MLPTDCEVATEYNLTLPRNAMQVIKRPAIIGQCPAPTWERILFLVQETRTPVKS